ncbi:MAG: LysR family transcriptional regulator [Alphaproteobacteria bacterium]|nr:LysR family transcriptional regulator [Alphaproteobacteria bacterium SS10]
MDTLSLRLFIRIAQRGGLSPAARDLGLSPATASARLRGLEETVGVRLFNRTTRALSLTADGQAFMPYAQSAVELLEEGVVAAAGVAPGAQGASAVRGVLRMAASASFARMHIMPALPAFMVRHPAISLDLQLSDDMEDMVEGAYDLAIRNAELSDSTMIARQLAPDDRILVASPAYIANRGMPQTAQELAAHDCIVTGQADHWQFASGAAFKIRPRLRVNDGEAARLAAEAGLGITLKSRWNVYRSLATGALVPVLVGDQPVTKSAIWAVAPSARLMPPKVRAMIDFLVDRFGPKPYWVT